MPGSFSPTFIFTTSLSSILESENSHFVSSNCFYLKDQTPLGSDFLSSSKWLLTSKHPH